MASISKEDAKYLFKLEEQIAMLADRLVAIELAHDEVMFDIKQSRHTKIQFMEQLYVKYGIDKTKNVGIDPMTGEIVNDETEQVLKAEAEQDKEYEE
jgi:hypothetical protein